LLLSSGEAEVVMVPANVAMVSAKVREAEAC